MELPKVLQSLLCTLMDGNSLSSWNIFNEKSGQTVVKLRFTGRHHGHEQQSATEKPASYRRKPPSQAKRDAARLADHKQWVHAGALSMSTTDPCLPTVTRATAEVDMAPTTAEPPAIRDGPAARTRSTAKPAVCDTPETLRADPVVSLPSPDVLDISTISNLDPDAPPFTAPDAEACRSSAGLQSADILSPSVADSSDQESSTSNNDTSLSESVVETIPVSDKPPPPEDCELCNFWLTHPWGRCPHHGTCASDYDAGY